MSLFTKGVIKDVGIYNLKKILDPRGYLVEMFRKDWLDDFKHPYPVMGYMSMSHPGTIRGPHEHKDQTDVFSFIGPGNFEMRLWDNRPNSETYNKMMQFYVGEDNPTTVVVPPGVVHGYKLLSPYCGWVLNYPDQLYRGVNYKQPVDEIRHEADPVSEFKFDE